MVELKNCSFGVKQQSLAHYNNSGQILSGKQFAYLKRHGCKNEKSHHSYILNCINLHTCIQILFSYNFVVNMEFTVIETNKRHKSFKEGFLLNFVNNDVY
jgi:hypothetical protein